ncbi:MAG: amino acid ABC transporter permease [Eubacteriaceae bacterium]|nr:amino acid ABC transporter permease [Eubacteriaceae bacterium]
MSMAGPMIDGCGKLLAIFFLTLAFSLPLGLLVAFGRMSKHKIISTPIRIYQLVMRGTPLILQLMVVFYAPSFLFKIRPSRFTACITAFVINYAAYFAEILRAGIEGIPQGQHEAAKALGYTTWQKYTLIIIPQVTKRVLPPMGNEFMTLLKDTALSTTIGIAELFRATSNAAIRMVSVAPYLAAGLIYFALNSIVEKAFQIAENKLGYYKIL